MHINSMPCAQVTHKSREESLDGAHGVQHIFGNRMSHTASVTSRFFAYERRKIDVGVDKFYMHHLLVEMCPLRSKEACAASCLVFDERDKSAEEDERAYDEKEIRHGG